MREYHKIDSVYKRDDRGKFILGEYSRPEFEYLVDKPWLWTEKIDGTNIRIMWDGEEIRFGGKTDNAQIPTKLLGHLQSIINREFMTDAFGTEGNVCLYGEGYGAGIQKGGRNYSSEQKFILFDVKIGDWWLERPNVEDIANKLGVDIVPVLGHITLESMIRNVSEGFEPISRVSPDAHAEGYVGTPSIPLFNRKGERIITKIKYRDFR